MELLLQLSDAIISRYDSFFFLFDGSENILLLHNDIHIDSLLLVDIAVPDLDGQLLLCDLLLIVDRLGVSIGQASQILDHLCEDVNLVLDDGLVLLDQGGVLFLQLLQFLLVDVILHLAFDLLLGLGHDHDVLVLISDLLEVLLNLLVHALLGSLPHGIVELAHFDDQLVVPAQLSVVEEADELLAGAVGLKLLALEIVLQA